MLSSNTVFGNFKKKVRSLTVLEYAHQNETFQVYFSNSVASFTFIDDVFPSFFTTRLEVTYIHTRPIRHIKKSPGSLVAPLRSCTWSHIKVLELESGIDYGFYYYFGFPPHFAGIMMMQ